MTPGYDNRGTPDSRNRENKRPTAFPAPARTTASIKPEYCYSTNQRG